MGLGLRIGFAGLACLAIVLAGDCLADRHGSRSGRPRASATPKTAFAAIPDRRAAPAGLWRRGRPRSRRAQSFPDPNAAGHSSRVYIDRSELDQGVFLAVRAFAPARDDASLEDLAESLRSRASQALALLNGGARPPEARLADGRTGLPGDPDPAVDRLRPHARRPIRRGGLVARAGPGAEPDSGHARRARANLRPCWGSSPCGGARSRTASPASARRAASSRSPARPSTARPPGSREAIRQFTAYLDERPEDLGVRWLLNVAYMTLGEYPDEGPAAVPDPARRRSARSSTSAGSTNVAAAGRPDRRGARTWPAAASSTTSTATACPTSSPPRSTPTAGPRCSSTGATARSRTAPTRPAWTTRSTP